MENANGFRTPLPLKSDIFLAQDTKTIPISLSNLEAESEVMLRQDTHYVLKIL